MKKINGEIHFALVEKVKFTCSVNLVIRIKIAKESMHRIRNLLIKSNQLNRFSRITSIYQRPRHQIIREIENKYSVW